MRVRPKYAFHQFECWFSKINQSWKHYRSISVRESNNTGCFSIIANYNYLTIVWRRSHVGFIRRTVLLPSSIDSCLKRLFLHFESYHLYSFFFFVKRADIRKGQSSLLFVPGCSIRIFLNFTYRRLDFFRG